MIAYTYPHRHFSFSEARLIHDEQPGKQPDLIIEMQQGDQAEVRIRPGENTELQKQQIQRLNEFTKRTEELAKAAQGAKKTQEGAQWMREQAAKWEGQAKIFGIDPAKVVGGGAAVVEKWADRVGKDATGQLIGTAGKGAPQVDRTIPQPRVEVILGRQQPGTPQTPETARLSVEQTQGSAERGRTGQEGQQELPREIREIQDHFKERYKGLDPERQKIVMDVLAQLPPAQARALAESHKVLSAEEMKIYEGAGPKIMDRLSKLSPDGVRKYVRSFSGQDPRSRDTFSPEDQKVLNETEANLTDKENAVWRKLDTEYDRLMGVTGLRGDVDQLRGSTKLENALIIFERLLEKLIKFLEKTFGKGGVGTQQPGRGPEGRLGDRAPEAGKDLTTEQKAEKQKLLDQVKKNDDQIKKHEATATNLEEEAKRIENSNEEGKTEKAKALRDAATEIRGRIEALKKENKELKDKADAIGKEKKDKEKDSSISKEARATIDAVLKELGLDKLQGAAEKLIGHPEFTLNEKGEIVVKNIGGVIGKALGIKPEDTLTLPELLAKIRGGKDAITKEIKAADKPSENTEEEKKRADLQKTVEGKLSKYLPAGTKIEGAVRVESKGEGNYTLVISMSAELARVLPQPVQVVLKAALTLAGSVLTSASQKIDDLKKTVEGLLAKLPPPNSPGDKAEKGNEKTDGNPAEVIRQLLESKPGSSEQHLAFLKEAQAALAKMEGKTDEQKKNISAELQKVDAAVNMQKEIISVYRDTFRGNYDSDIYTRNSMGVIRAMPDGTIRLSQIPDTRANRKSDSWPSRMQNAFGGRSSITFEEFRQLSKKADSEPKSKLQRMLQVEADYQGVQASIDSKIGSGTYEPFRRDLITLKNTLTRNWDNIKKFSKSGENIQIMEAMVNFEKQTGNIRFELTKISGDAMKHWNEETAKTVARLNLIADALEGTTEVLYTVGSTLTSRVAGPAGPIASSIAYNLYRNNLGLINNFDCGLNIAIDTVSALYSVGTLASKLIKGNAPLMKMLTPIGEKVAAQIAKAGGNPKVVAKIAEELVIMFVDSEVGKAAEKAIKELLGKK